MDNKGGLFAVVGMGIQLGSDLTRAAEGYIKNADKVFYLVNIAQAAEWIEQLNSNTESLQDLYFVHKNRLKNYIAIAEHVANNLESGKYTTFVLYGHPGVFAMPSHRAIALAKQKGFRTKMLPGISAEDWLYADLGVDPGVSGCMSFEVTDFLVCQHSYSPFSHLLLWQIGSLGNKYLADTEFPLAKNLEVLTEELLKSYPSNHEIVLYQAALFATEQAKIRRFELAKLAQQDVELIDTLYIPPLDMPKANINQDMIKRLGLADLN